MTHGVYELNKLKFFLKVKTRLSRFTSMAILAGANIRYAPVPNP